MSRILVVSLCALLALAACGSDEEIVLEGEEQGGAGQGGDRTGPDRPDPTVRADLSSPDRTVRS